MKIYTKNISDSWHSFTTVKGYDYTESGKTIEMAQSSIRKKLESMGFKFEEMDFVEPAISYTKQQPYDNPFAIKGYMKNRIDNL